MVASIGSVTTDASGNAFKVVLADDVSAGYQTSNWGNAYNGGTYWNGAFDWSANDVAVRSGEMQVTDTRHADGSWTAGGFNSMKAGQSITYGTVEFDARVEQAQGTQAAILMWPVSDNWPRDGEIDILEAPKNQAMHSSHWEGTDGSHQYSSIFSTIDPSKTHHYAMTWLPNEVTIRVDGQVVASWTDAAAIPDTAMGFGAMGYVAAKGEAWLGDAPDSTTPSVVTTHIDNVVMSQWTGTVPIEPKVDTTPVVKTIGSGTDNLVLKISQDVYKAGAQYTFSVDGKQIGGTLTAGAVHGSGQTDVITVKGEWAAGAHKVTVNFLNDTWGGSSSTDSNLHVDGITYNGKALAAGTANLMSNGPVDFDFTEAAPVIQPFATVAAHLGTAPMLSGASASQIWMGQLDFGTTYQTYGSVLLWGTGAGATLKPAQWDAAHATKLSFDNFVQTDIDLARFGSNDFDLMLVSAKRGTVGLGDGNDHVTWVAHSNGSTTAAFSNTMTIKTGGGDDVVKVTAAGLSSLADYDKTGNGSMYNPYYDGKYSTADVTFGSGHDSVTVEGKATLVRYAGTGQAIAVGGAGNDFFYAGSGDGDFTGGAGRDTFILDRGDGHVTIQDFTSGTDKLKFMGLTKADIHTAAATEDGVAGLRVTYDADGDSVFLAHVSKIGATDMLFA